MKVHASKNKSVERLINIAVMVAAVAIVVASAVAAVGTDPTVASGASDGCQVCQHGHAPAHDHVARSAVARR
jgi:hypothetical protein